MIRLDDIIDKVSSSYSEKAITLLKKAYVFSAQAHKGQIRRSGEPYLSHPLEVTNMLADMKLDATTLVAGLLHDVLEDTDITALDIEQAFGKEVAHLVEGVTKISRVQESSPETRQAESIRKVILAMTDDLRVIFIKLADRIHNLKTLKFLPEEKQKQIAKETLEIYAPIANRLGMGRIKAELEDLSFRYVEPEQFFNISALVEPQKKKAERELKRIKKALEVLFKENGIPAQLYYRIKRPYSVYHKMGRQHVEFEQVYDFIALRLITNSIKNCYAMLGIIHQNWPHIPHRFRDFIAMPKPNLYQALHTTIITEKKQTIEIQIRTQDMHHLAVNGIAAHWKYKERDARSIMREDTRLLWLREMADLYKEQKSPREFLKTLKTDLITEELYVFTPKGKVIALPLGSSALDFAFNIHSEIGFHAFEAKINGKRAPLKAILHTGDIVEILTSPDKKPKREWLNIVFTSRARHLIKRWLKRQDKVKNVALGKRLWEKELEKRSLALDYFSEDDIISRFSRMTTFRVKKMEDLYALIGFGKLILNKKLMDTLFPQKEFEKKKETLLKKVVTKVTKKPTREIQVRETGGATLSLAKCCSPIKGEPIIGYITAGKGITIHSLRCPLVSKEILDSQRMVEIRWDESLEGPFSANLIIKSDDSPGVLAKLTSVIAQSGGNISKADVTTSADKKAQIRLSLSIRDIDHLESIIKKISGIREVSSVVRP